MNPIILDDLKFISKNMNINIFDKTTVLITGATSFIGSYIIRTLMYLNRTAESFNCTVISLCRNEKKALKLFSEFIDDERFQIIVQDVTTPLSIEANVNFIFHAASPASTAEHRLYPVETLTSNLMGTHNVLAFAKKCSDFKGLLYFSSGAVYGNTEPITHLISENDYYPIDPLDCHSFYAVAKRAGESICSAYWHEYKVPSKIIRISHTYGPGINLNDGHVYSDFVKNILSNSDLIIKGDGQQYRPFTYISDCITAIFKIVEKGKLGKAYNMANNGAYYSIC